MGTNEKRQKDSMSPQPKPQPSQKNMAKKEK